MGSLTISATHQAEKCGLFGYIHPFKIYSQSSVICNSRFAEPEVTHLCTNQRLMEFSSTNLPNFYFEPTYFFGICNILQQKYLQLNLAPSVYFQHAALLQKRQKWGWTSQVFLKWHLKIGLTAHAHLVPECKNMSPKALNILPSGMSLISQPPKYRH